jgi:hypothetical protein
MGSLNAQPVSFALVGTSDGVSWNPVDTTYTNTPYTTPNAVISISFSTARVAYPIYRLVVTRVAFSSPPTSSFNPVTVCQLQLFGRPATASLACGANAAVFTGNVGIGTSTPNQALDVRGSIAASGSVGIGNPSATPPAYALQLFTNSAAKPGSSMWTISSDARIKEDIVPANTVRCYDIVQQLPLKRFGWKKDVYDDVTVGDRNKLGWIAQDVEAVFPNAVTRSPMHGFDDCRALDIDQLIAALYGAVQELQRRVDTLSNQLNFREQISSNQ